MLLVIFRITDSVAELEYNTWNDACAWEFRSASGNSPPGLIQNPPTEIISSTDDTRCYTDEDESPGEFGHGRYVNSDIHVHVLPPQFCLGQQHSLYDNRIQNISSIIIHRLYPKLAMKERLIELDTVGVMTVPQILGCLPRCLYLPWVIDGMTKINGPYSDMLLRKTRYDGGGRRGVCTSDTAPAAYPTTGFSLALIGRRASVGGSVGLADWPHVLGAVDKPPGGVWIGFIRITSQLFVCQ